jgi:hypothetical protein
MGPCTKHAFRPVKLPLLAAHGQTTTLQVRSRELVAVCDRCLQPVDEATFQANMRRLQVCPPLMLH